MNLDKIIKEDIEETFEADSRIDKTNIDVAVNNSKVVLEGSVPSQKSKTAAEEDAWVTNGVKNVTNNLTVKLVKTETTPTDSELTDRLKKFLSWHTDIDATNITPVVKNLWVTLRGTVPTYWEKVQAELVTLKLSGLVGVTNELSVVPSENIADDIIAQNVTEAIKRNTNVNMDNITIHAEDGKVTLMGRVRDWNAKRSAYDAATLTLGVKEVDDQIFVT